MNLSSIGTSGLLSSSFGGGLGIALLLVGALLHTVRTSHHSSYTGGTYATGAATASAASTTTTATTAATARSTAARTFRTLTLAVGTLGLLTSRLRLAGKLDRDLALENLLAGELLDGTLGLSGSREVDEGVTDRTVGAGVLWDGDGLAGDGRSAQGSFSDAKCDGGVCKVVCQVVNRCRREFPLFQRHQVALQGRRCMTPAGKRRRAGAHVVKAGATDRHGDQRRAGRGAGAHKAGVLTQDSS